MSLIRVDYENARAQARRLEQSGQQCSQIARELLALQRQLAGVWTGEAADAYDQVIAQRLREIRKIQDEASRIAWTIRNVADELEAAEERAKAAMAAQETPSFGGGGSGGGGSR